MRDISVAMITGPTGAIGTALCRCLIDTGCTVYAVVRPNSSRIDQLPVSDRLHLVECDLKDIKLLPEKMFGIKVDAFFHLGWAHTIGAGRNDMPAQIANVQYTIDAVQSAAALGCQVFIGAGSQAEYGRVDGVLQPETPCFPENGYGMAKLCAGQMSRVECQKYGIDHIWTRILSIYGPCDGTATMVSSTIEKLLKGEKPALTEGTQQWDYLYSDDAAEALYLMAKQGKNGAVYPLGSGEARPLREYIEMMRDAIDPNLPLGFGEIPFGSKQVMLLQADISSLVRDTGWYPQICFSDGVSNTIKWIRDERT